MSAVILAIICVIKYLLRMPTAPQTKPENFQLATASSKCVKLSYGDVLYTNGPLDELIYQVTLRW